MQFSQILAVWEDTLREGLCTLLSEAGLPCVPNTHSQQPPTCSIATLGGELEHRGRGGADARGALSDACGDCGSTSKWVRDRMTQ